MPKNGNRGANSKKSNVPFASTDDIDSNVVFGDAKNMKKAKQGSRAEDSAKTGGGIVPASSDVSSKKPDTRTLVSRI